MSPFDIGHQFEDFVEKRIFPFASFTLVEKTPNIDQNRERFVESSLNPDFKFRCNDSIQEFWVEAKYRSGFNAEEKVELFSYTQLERFKSLNKKEHPVFLIVGVGGTSANPDILSFIPISEIKYINLYRSFINKYKVEKTPYQIKDINNRVQALFPAVETTKEQSTPTIKSKTDWRYKPVYLGISILVILMFILGYRTISTPSLHADEKLKAKIESYYNVLEHNNVSMLDHYLHDKIDRWYDHSNVDAAFVLEDTEAYNEKYPIREINIEWPTYKETRLPNGDFSVSYYLIYKIKTNNRSDFKTYFLNIKAIWGKDMKLRSMYEERLD